MMIFIIISFIFGIAEGLFLYRFLNCILYSKDGVKAVLLIFAKLIVFALFGVAVFFFSRDNIILPVLTLTLGLTVTSVLLAIKTYKKGKGK